MRFAGFSAAALAFCLLGAAALASPQGTVISQKTADGIIFATPQGFLQIAPWSDRIVHVMASRDAAWQGTFKLSVIGFSTHPKWRLRQTASAYTVSTKDIQVRIARKTGAVSFYNASGKPIAAEPQDARILPTQEAQTIGQSFIAHGGYYGLGQHPDGKMDYRGTTVHLQQENKDVGVPMLAAQDGYGILWNNASVTDVDVAIPAAPKTLFFRSEAGGGIDYYFVYGPKLDAVVAGYRALTGDAPLMARWSWGLFQSKEHYATRQELLDVAAKYRAMNVPLDAVVQDWQYWVPGQWGSHQMDPARYPEPAGMVKTLHDENVHVIISVWPRFDLGTANLAELDKAGAAYPDVYPNVYPKGEGRWYDPFSAAGRRIYWDQIMRTLGADGFDGWWLDASEAELGGQWGQMRDVMTADGSGKRVYNAYPLMHTMAVHDGMRRDQPDKRVFILTRSAFAGQQRNGAITWSGDTMGDWQTFKLQIPEGLNFSLSGIPYWSSDIGGFFSGDPASADYAQLFTRWFQFAVFNPMFRIHGTNYPKEIWRFPEETQKVLIDYDRLRYRLLPYIYSLSWQVTHHRGTMMRPLVMDFQNDPNAAESGDQYLFGNALLVNPVTQKDAVSRTVYLPGKTGWYDFWTGAAFHGGQTITAQADIATIPVFAHAGSILPLGPVLQYADQKSDAPVELRIYPGANGSFTLYNDAGDGYGYESGAYSTIRLLWNNARHRLTIAARQGTFPGMSKEVAFKVSCGAASAKGATKGISYSGAATSVSLPQCR